MMDMEREVNGVVVHAFATGESEYMEYGFPKYAVHVIDVRVDRDDVIFLGFPTREAAEREFCRLLSELNAGWKPF